MPDANLPNSSAAISRAAGRASLPLAFWILLLVAAVAGAYHNALPGEFLFDDVESIPDNPSIRQFSTAWIPPADSGRTVAGRPLLNVSFALNRLGLGPGPAGFHAVNIGIHALATLALFALARAALRGPVLRTRWAARADEVAAGIALLWAVHPLATESVTYIVQRAESLVGLWILLALLAFARGTEASTSARDGGAGDSSASSAGNRTARWWWLLSFIATLLGVLTKEVAAVVPLLAWLYDAAFVSGSLRAAWRARGRIFAWLATSWLLLALLVWHTGNRGGTAGIGTTIDSWNYLVTQSRGLWRYLALSVWPHPLVIDYGVPVWRLAEVWPFALALLLLLAATVWAVWRRPAVGFPGAWFFVLLAPSSSVIPVSTQTLAEHRMYLPLVAVVAAVVMLAWSRLGRGAWFAVVALAVLGVVTTIRRNADYRTAEGMWRLTAQQCSENPRAWAGWGTVVLNAGRVSEALPLLERAVAIAPADVRYRLTLARAHADAARWEDAWREFEETLRLAPAMYEARMSYANALVKAGRTADAVVHLQHACALKPASIEAQFNLANALWWSGRAGEALPHFEAALALDPSAIDARTNFAAALFAAGKPDAALAQAEAVLARDAAIAPAHFVVAQVKLAGRDAVRAEAALRATLRLDPAHRDARYTLAQFLLEAERGAEAEREFAEFLKLEPNAAAAHNARGIALAQLGRLAEARDAFARAVSLAPDFSDARENLRRAQAELAAPR